MKKKIFSQSDPVLIRQSSKKLQSDPVLIRAHLWLLALNQNFGPSKFLAPKNFGLATPLVVSMVGCCHSVTLCAQPRMPLGLLVGSTR